MTSPIRIARSAGKPNCFGSIKLDFARSNRRLQVVNDLAQIFNQIDVFIVGSVSKALVGTANSIHATCCFVEPFA